MLTYMMADSVGTESAKLTQT